jgi:hypothetical protein
VIYPGGPLDGHVFRDNLSYGNAALALSFANCCSTFTNGTLARLTAFGNGAGNATNAGGPSLHADMLQSEINKFSTVQDNKIERVLSGSGNITSQTGGGARLRHRYVNGVLMDGSNGQPAQQLWPWPMESRIQAELGVSVTTLLAGIVPDQVNGLPPPSAPTSVHILQ